ASAAHFLVAFIPAGCIRTGRTGCIIAGRTDATRLSAMGRTAWTAVLARRMLKGEFVLHGDGGGGIACVHVDNLADAIVLAEAGLVRLGVADRITEILDQSWMLPAVGQGAIGLECRADEGQVAAAPGEKLVVGSVLGHTALVQNHDPVGIGDGREPVGDGDDGAAPAHGLEAFLNLDLGLAVERTRRFVEKQDRRVLQKRARDPHPLFLATREFQATLAHLGLVTIGQAFNKAMDVCGVCSRFNFGLTGARAPIANVIRNGVVKQHGILGHDANLRAQRLLLHLCDVLPINQDLAVTHVVKPVQQPCQSGFARTAVAHHCHRFPGGNFKTEFVQHLPAWFVMKIHRAKFNGGLLQYQKRCAWEVLHFAVFIEQGKHAIDIGQRLLDFPVNNAQKIQWNIQLNHEGIDQHQVAQGHGTIEHTCGAAPQNSRYSKSNNGCLTRIEHNQRALRFNGGFLPGGHTAVVTVRFELFVAKVFDSFVIDERIHSTHIGL
ncbi:MAG: hypothetical protein HC848_07675, partial [Limnobacter sp.]|nr:hypothetical protein [Limnobacter sp.]